MRQKNGVGGARVASTQDRLGGGGGRGDRKNFDRGHHQQSSSQGNSGGGRNARRSRSTSPIKSKLMALAMSTSGAKTKGVGGGGGNERDKGRRNISTGSIGRESGRDRERDSEVSKRKLRMDELEDKRGGKRVVRSPVRSRPLDSGMRKKGATTLDKVVKKAREERSNYWDKKILEVEDKDPQRWGHSGFRELYQKDFKRTHGHGSPPKGRRSRSNSLPRKIQAQRSPSPRFRHHQNHSRSRSISRRSRSRSRSPMRRIAKPRKDNRRSRSSSSPELASKPKTLIGRTGGLTSKSKGDIKLKSRSSNIGESFKPRGVTTTHGTSLGAKGKNARIGERVVEKGGIRSRLGAPSRRAPQNRTSSSDSSMSRSRSRSMSPVVKRPVGLQSKDKYTRGKRPAPSDSESSSSSSSDDGDVLQLHARKGRSASLSYSDSQSSTSRSRSPSRPRRAQPQTSSSSSGSGSSSDTESDESIRNKPKANPPSKGTKVATAPVKAVSKSSTQQRQTPQGTKKPTANTVPAKNKKPVANKSDSDSSSSSVIPIAPTAGNKKPSSGGVDAASSKEKQKQGTSEGANKVAKGKPSVAATKPTVEKEKSPPAIKKPAPKSASESGETETETESSSDSDSEPRMTLSERFSKLQHTNTDKREMAKPVLSVNEIDTKMKVVKDFRNPDIPKVYVTGHGVMDKSFNKVRPKTPEYSDGEKRFASEERRRHFERMYRDEPAERPLDWSDARVRYNYYKERGCFDERPISLDEYVKWEDWYHKYREWLEREGYYERMAGGPVGGGPPPSSMMGNGGNWPSQPQYGPGPGLLGQGPGLDRMRPNYPQRGRRVDHMGGGPPAPLSSRAHFGRPEGEAYLQGSIGRRIDRTPGGSLVVNIHPGNNGGGGRGGRPGNYGPRGRRLGRGLGRPR